MKKLTTHQRSRHSARITLGSLFATGLASALFISGFALLDPAPASAAGNSLSYANSPSSGTAGSNISVVVQTSDHGGVGDTITLSTSPSRSGSQITGYTAVVGSGGTANFSNFSINTVGTYEVTATDSTHPDEYSSVGQSNVTITPGNAHQIAFSSGPPWSSTWDTDLSKFTVSVQDAYGNTVTGNDDVITLTSSCGLGGDLTSTASNGVATFDAVKFTSGTSCKLTAKDTTTVGLATTTSHAVSMFGTAYKLAFSSPLPPTTATQDVSMATFKVSVQDTRGVRVASGTGAADYVTVTAAGAGCTLDGSTVTKKADEGVATFSGVKFVSGATCTLVATDSSRSLLSATSAGITLATSSAGRLGFTKQPPTKSSAGDTLASFKVSVEESNGIPVTSGTGTNDTVTLTSSCKLAGTTSAVAVAGVATFGAAVLDTAGSCTLVANDASRSLSAATSSATIVSAAKANHLAFTTAPPDIASSSSAPIAAFRVSVEDVYGNTVTSGTGSTDTILVTSPCVLVGATSVVAVAGVATFSNVTATTQGGCVLTASDLSRSVIATSATTTVGKSQSALRVISVDASLGRALTLRTSGGSGSGAVTFVVNNGTATGCTVTNGRLRSSTMGTCLVTATKAASGDFAAMTSATATITVGPTGPRAKHVEKFIWSGRTVKIRVLGSGFRGRPRIVSNVAGFRARVTRDTGKALTVIVTVHGWHRSGIRVMTIIMANHLRTSIRYRLHAA